jgi:hypothetical protein
MHDIRCRRRRNQAEIDQFILEFQKSGLSPPAFAQYVGVQVQTVVRSLKTASVDLTVTDRNDANPKRLMSSASPDGLAAVEVRLSPPD